MPQITFHTATIFKNSFYCRKPVCNGRRGVCVLLMKRASSVGATTNFNHFCSSSPSTFSFSEEQAPLEHYGYKSRNEVVQHHKYHGSKL